MNQKVITIFIDFKSSGNTELPAAPAGWIIKQISTSAIENATHTGSSDLKQPRLAVTYLLEKND